MLAGAVFFAIETGIGRAYLLEQGAGAVRGGHYMYVVAYLMLPAVALVAEAIVRRWRVVIPVLVVLFLVAIPVNARALVEIENKQAPTLARFRSTLLLIPQLPLAKHVPRSERPYPTVARAVTIGWLLDAAREGKLPRRHFVSPKNRAIATLQISFVLTRSRTTPCRPLRAPVTRRVPAGGTVRFRGAEIRVGYISAGKQIESIFFRTAPAFHAAESQLVNVGRPLTVRLQRGRTNTPANLLCD
jgi:hypothetical protein